MTGDEAIAAAQQLAKREGIFTGISGGAGMASALKVSAGAPPLAPRSIPPARLTDARALLTPARAAGARSPAAVAARNRAASQLAETAPKGSVILTMLPDTAERYLSTPLFANIAADMDEDEVGISESTPGFRLS